MEFQHFGYTVAKIIIWAATITVWVGFSFDCLKAPKLLLTIANFSFILVEVLGLRPIARMELNIADYLNTSKMMEL